MKDFSRVRPTFQIRRIAACNLVKMACLGNQNMHGQHQSKLILPILEEFSERGDPLDQRTWCSWLKGERQLKAKNVDLLDHVFESKTKKKNFIKGLIEAWQPEDARRIMDWPIHLHFDALDAASYCGGNNDNEWRMEKQRRAESVFHQLHEAWNPTYGWVYSTFRSDLAIKYENADIEERARLKSLCAKFKPDLFNYQMKIKPGPSHELTYTYDLFSPANIWKFLFSLTADQDFLIEERLERWSIDLASASAALYGNAYSRRYETFGSVYPPEEVHFINGADDLFWNQDTDLDTVLWRLGIGDQYEREYVAESFAPLWNARNIYRELMSDLGISIQAIANLMQEQWKARPLVFRG